MSFWDESRWRSYCDCVEDLLTSPEVRSMREIRHHPGVSCYEHSVFVSYTAFRLAERMGLDSRTAARGGLLHDLYLYDPHTLHSSPTCGPSPAAGPTAGKPMPSAWPTRCAPSPRCSKSGGECGYTTPSCAKRTALCVQGCFFAGYTPLFCTSYLKFSS